MKKLSKVLSFNKEGLKNVAPLMAGVAMGSVAVGLVAADYQNTQKMAAAVPETAIEVPATEEIELTPAQMQEVMYILRSLRGMAEDNMEKDWAWVNTQIAIKLTHTLGQIVDAKNSRELLTVIDAAIADLDATLSRTKDNGLER